MTIEDMQIDFQLKLQEVYNYTFGDFTDEEIDWILNEHMFKFIEYRTDPKSNRKLEGFESTQKRYDDIENLITFVTLPVIENDGFVSAYLPSNYFKLVSEEPSVNCNIFNKITTTKSIHKFKIIPDDSVDSLDYYRLVIQDGSINDIVLFDSSDYFTGNISSNLFKDLEKIVLDKLLNFETSKVFVISTNKKIELFSIDYPFNIVIDTGGRAVTSFPNNEPIEILDKTTQTFVDSRLTNHEDLPRLLNNYFSRTKLNSVVSTLSEGKIFAYYSNFYINCIKLTYVKKPAYMSKLFGISCNLGSREGQKYNICRQIVDAAVATTAGRLSSQNTAILKENFLLTE